MAPPARPAKIEIRSFGVVPAEDESGRKVAKASENSVRTMTQSMP
jgi:hypothetical protein